MDTPALIALLVGAVLGPADLVSTPALGCRSPRQDNVRLGGIAGAVIRFTGLGAGVRVTYARHSNSTAPVMPPAPWAAVS